MLKQAYALILSPRGRIGRKSFLLGVLALCLVMAVSHYVVYPALGNGSLNFYIAPVFFFLMLHIILCVFGKRLHDFGRSSAILIGMFLLFFTVIFYVMLQYGGMEYFETIHDNPARQGDEDFMRSVHATYQEKLAANVVKSSILMSIVPVLFTLWLAIKKGQPEANRYGQPPQISA